MDIGERSRVDPAPASRSALGSASDLFGVTAFAVLFLAVSGRLASHASGFEVLALLCVALPLGHLIADLAGGLVHWFADEFFEEDTPLLGPLLIHGFREHHRNPRDIALHGVMEVSGYNALATLPVLAALLLLPVETTAARFGQLCVLALLCSVAATNQLHRWAHADAVPALVDWLQRHRLILSPEGHARHHDRGDRAYCVTAGWWNPPLDALGLLPALGAQFHRLARRLGLSR